MQLTVTTQLLLHTPHTFYTPSFSLLTSTLLHSLSPGFQLSTWDAGNASHREPVSYLVSLYTNILNNIYNMIMYSGAWWR